MKRILNIIPIPCILILLVLCVYMPQFTSMVFDYKLEEKIVQRENTYISLQLLQTSDFFQILETFNSKQFQIELTEGYQMTSEEVENIALEIMGKLAISGLIYSDPPKVTPVLVANKDIPEMSGVFWYCIWSEASDINEVSQNDVLWIDDKSGQMVSLQQRIKVSHKIMKNTDTLEIVQFVESDGMLFHKTALMLAEFCRLYYPVDDVKLTLEKERDNFSRYTLTLIRNNNNQDDTYEIPIRFQDNWIYFNP